MKNYLLCFVFFLAAPTIFAQPGGRVPPPTTEIYATANDGTPLTWVVYTPPGQGPWPAVLVIHGGRFIGGSPNDGGLGACARDLADAGYIAFAITYRLAPPGSLPGQRSLGRFPDQYDDVQLAVLAARNDRRSDGHVGAVGGSAGGTHTAWVAATGQRGADRIDVGVSLSGAYDFSDFRPDPNLPEFIETVTNYVGVSETDIVPLRAASPAWVLDRTVAPLFLADTENDSMPSAQLDDMVAQLRKNGANNFQATTLRGDLHSFAYWPQVKNEAIDFLGRYLDRRHR